MTKKDFLEIVECGGNVTVNADDFTLHEVRQLARAAAKSGVMVTITNGNAFTPQELKIIASDGKGHVSFVDLKIGLH